jgi:hypothetical protein
MAIEALYIHRYWVTDSCIESSGLIFEKEGILYWATNYTSVVGVEFLIAAYRGNVDKESIYKIQSDILVCLWT